LFPHREWDRLLYFTLSIGLSLAGDVLCGLLLNFTPWGLTPATWTVALSILVLFGAVVDAAIRIRALPDWQSKPNSRGWRSLPVSGLQVGMLIGALVLVVAAGAIAYESKASAATAQQVVQMWMSPTTIHVNTATQIRVNVSEQGPPLSTKLYVVILVNG